MGTCPGDTCLKNINYQSPFPDVSRDYNINPFKDDVLYEYLKELNNKNFKITKRKGTNL